MTKTKTQSRKTSAVKTTTTKKPASRQPSRSSPRNSRDGTAQADEVIPAQLHKAHHLTNAIRGQYTAKDWSEGQIIHVTRLGSYLKDNEDDDDDDDDDDQDENDNERTKTHAAIIAAVYEHRMLVLPIFTERKGELEIDLDVVNLSLTPSPGSFQENLSASAVGNFLAISGSWAPGFGAHVKLNFIVAVEYDWDVWELDDLDSRSTKLLKQRLKFVLGREALHHYRVDDQEELMQCHVFARVDDRPTQEWYDGWEAAKDYFLIDEGEVDSCGIDNDKLTATKATKKSPKTGKGGKIQAEKAKNPAATKKDTGAKRSAATDTGNIDQADAATGGDSDKDTAEDEAGAEAKSKNTKAKPTHAERDVKFCRVRQRPDGRWTCQHDPEAHGAGKCACGCCNKGTAKPPVGWIGWDRERREGGEGQAPRPAQTQVQASASRVNGNGAVKKPKTSKKPKKTTMIPIKQVAQDFAKAAEDAGLGDGVEDSSQESSEAENEEQVKAKGKGKGKGKSKGIVKAIATATSTKTTTKAPVKKGSGSRTNNVPRNASGDAQSKAKAKVKTATKKSSQPSASGTPAGGVQKTSATRKGSNDSSISSRSDRSGTASAAEAMVTRAENSHDADAYAHDEEANEVEKVETVEETEVGKDDDEGEEE